MLPDKIVPDSLGGIGFRSEPKVEGRLAGVGPDALIDAARVYTFRDDQAVQGYLQVGEFARGISGLTPEVRRGVLEGIGASRFRLTRLGRLRIYTASIGQEDFALWFTPEGTTFELLVSRRTFTKSLDLFGAILGYQGRTVGTVRGGVVATPPDSRRGVDG